MLTLQVVCFFALVVISTCKNYTFIQLKCYQLSATPIYSPYSLERAVDLCVSMVPSCVGIREVSENSFSMLKSPFTHVIKTGETTDYFYDRSNGTNLNGAPTVLDSKLIFGIYFHEKQRNCPNAMNEVNGRCEGTEGGEAWCQSFPAFTNNTYDPKTGICSLVRLQDIVKAWQ